MALRHYLFCFVLAFFVLTGCATVKECEPVYVNKVVTVPCVKEVPKEPELTSIRLPGDATLAEQIQAISVDVLILKQSNNELRAVMEGCR